MPPYDVGNVNACIIHPVYQSYVPRRVPRHSGFASCTRVFTVKSRDWYDICICTIALFLRHMARTYCLSWDLETGTRKRDTSYACHGLSKHEASTARQFRPISICRNGTLSRPLLVPCYLYRGWVKITAAEVWLLTVPGWVGPTLLSGICHLIALDISTCGHDLKSTLCWFMCMYIHMCIWKVLGNLES